jgi:hypothetical protein
MRGMSHLKPLAIERFTEAFRLHEHGPSASFQIGRLSLLVSAAGSDPH